MNITMSLNISNTNGVVLYEGDSGLATLLAMRLILVENADREVVGCHSGRGKVVDVTGTRRQAEHLVVSTGQDYEATQRVEIRA